jgi:hypothetical protein
VATNPYTSPTARVADMPRASAVPLWNPGAAGAWCLVLSTVFGSYLVMRNWEALGDPRERTARGWLYASIVYFVAAVLVPGVAYVGLPWLIAWYVVVNRPQIRYVKETFGNDYPRQPWGKALAIGFVLIIGVALTLGFLSVLLFGLNPEGGPATAR